MPMRKITMEELRPGMKFNKSLFDNNLNIVLPAGKILDDLTLRNLRTRHIEYIETVSSISSRSAGPATRINLDEYYTGFGLFGHDSTISKSKYVSINRYAL